MRFKARKEDASESTTASYEKVGEWERRQRRWSVYCSVVQKRHDRVGKFKDKEKSNRTKLLIVCHQRSDQMRFYKLTWILNISSCCTFSLTFQTMWCTDLYTPNRRPLLPTMPAGWSKRRVSPRNEVTMLALQSLDPVCMYVRQECMI